MGAFPRFTVAGCGVVRRLPVFELRSAIEGLQGRKMNVIGRDFVLGITVRGRSRLSMGPSELFTAAVGRLS